MSERVEEHAYDVCLSFAGEDRPYVRAVADALRERGIRVFYDEYQEVDLWGKDLYEHLSDVYKNAARYCVLFVSKHYAAKIWTTHERRSAQERALKENKEYILPARFDSTPVPGLRDTVGYINVRKHTPSAFAELVREKIGGHYRKEYLPPVPDRLFKLLSARSRRLREDATRVAYDFLSTLRRMSQDERKLVCDFFRNGCPAELPENVHINIDLLRRISTFPPNKIRRLLGGLRSLGFTTTIREDTENPIEELGTSEMLVLKWDDLSYLGPLKGTAVAHAMILGATSDYCEMHGQVALDRLDFSQLATATTVEDRHHRRGKGTRSRSVTKGLPAEASLDTWRSKGG